MKYTAPELEIFAFEAEDVITASSVKDPTLPPIGEEI